MKKNDSTKIAIRVFSDKLCTKRYMARTALEPLNMFETGVVRANDC